MSITLRSRRGPIGTSWHAVALREKGEKLLGPARVPRGKADARAGQVQWLDVDTGVARGAVQDPLGDLHEARLELPTLRPGDREAFLQVAHAHPELPARFAAGEYPEAVERELAEHELSLLPRDASELSHDCSCLDWPGPCRHVSALLYVLVEAVDESPVLLLTLRGLTLEDLVAPRTVGAGASGAPGSSVAAEPSDAADPSAAADPAGGGPAEAGADGHGADGADGGAAATPAGVFDPHRADVGRLAEVMGEEVAALVHAFFTGETPLSPDDHRAVDDEPRAASDDPRPAPDEPLQ